MFCIEQILESEGLARARSIVMYWLDNKSEPARGFGDVFDKSRVSLSLADARLDDAPLIGVNTAFCKMSGYTAEQALGRNCRFLQPSGGAGPVRGRMRSFIADDQLTEGKFVVPNVRADGAPFLNLVYMSKLKLDGKIRYILGSQFEIVRHDHKALGLYEMALQQDIRELRLVAGEMGMVMLGTFGQLASSYSIIAEMRLSDVRGDT